MSLSSSNSSSSAKSTTASSRRRASRLVRPISTPLSTAFSRAVSSGSKPTPSSMNGASRPAIRMRAGVGPVDAGEDLEQRALAGAVAPDDPEELPLVNVEGDVAQGAGARGTPSRVNGWVARSLNESMRCSGSRKDLWIPRASITTGAMRAFSLGFAGCAHEHSARGLRWCWRRSARRAPRCGSSMVGQSFLVRRAGHLLGHLGPEPGRPALHDRLGRRDQPAAVASSSRGSASRWTPSPNGCARRPLVAGVATIVASTSSAGRSRAARPASPRRAS